MRALEVSVRMKVRAGQLRGLKKQAAQCVKETRDKDTRTLRYDWFVSSDGTECETREAYVDSDGVIEHRVKNVAEAQTSGSRSLIVVKSGGALRAGR
jgi:quinol monooxygenase YgiN